LIPAKYSYSWALGVVNRLRDKYPRATEDVKRILKVSDRNLAAFLATGDPVFVDLRNLIHFCDNAARPLSNYYTDVELLQRISMFWRSKSGERVKKRVDACLKEIKL
jgi:hypothetical protein